MKKQTNETLNVNVFKKKTLEEQHAYLLSLQKPEDKYKRIKMADFDFSSYTKLIDTLGISLLIINIISFFTVLIYIFVFYGTGEFLLKYILLTFLGYTVISFIGGYIYINCYNNKITYVFNKMINKTEQIRNDHFKEWALQRYDIVLPEHIIKKYDNYNFNHNYNNYFIYNKTYYIITETIHQRKLFIRETSQQEKFMFKTHKKQQQTIEMKPKEKTSL